MRSRKKQLKEARLAHQRAEQQRKVMPPAPATNKRNRPIVQAFRKLVARYKVERVVYYKEQGTAFSDGAAAQHPQAPAQIEDADNDGVCEDATECADDEISAGALSSGGMDSPCMAANVHIDRE